MQGYGKHVIRSSEGSRHKVSVNDTAAGAMRKPIEGEQNIGNIWPSDLGQPGYNEKNRVLSTHDINVNGHGNARMRHLKQ